MIHTERANNMIKSYPSATQCYCGQESKLTQKTITTRYNDHFISVTGVPVYECSSHHEKMARMTRVKLRKVLKKAYDENKKVINYEQE